MRIHTDTLTEADLLAGCEAAGKFGHGRAFIDWQRTGSRSRAYAYNVYLSGDGTTTRKRTQHDRDAFVATWDQWGVFLAVLFDRDPDAKAGPYDGHDDFHRKTADQFMGAVVAE